VQVAGRDTGTVRHTRSMAQRVLVVGAGVVGLSCALRLLEAGHRVDVLARDLPLETTSSVAAALWYPYLAFPQDRVTAWARTSYDAFAAWSAVDGSGVEMRPGTEVFRGPTAEPWWVEAVPRLDRVAPPTGFADAWSFVTPLVDMPRYLAWLAARVLDAGATITRIALSALPEGPLVVNCSGLGSRLLAADTSTTPVRGQVVVVEQVGLAEWWLDGDAPTYVIPRRDDIVLGGTDDVGEWDRRPDPDVAADIVARATALVPQIAHAKVLRHRVGLRPARPAVRLERVGDVIHCYGHGGSGVTLSWGCADEVATLAAS
jgi:D-amino-acid oxidase